MGDLELGSMGAGPWGELVGEEGMREERVPTAFGLVAVGMSGHPKKPTLITFHDLGLNANSCFQSFFQYSDMAEVMDRFCVYHVNVPGQEDDAEPLPEGAPFPNLDEMAQIIQSVVEHFKIKSFVGFGVGMGANIMCRYAVKYPDMMDGLILVNCLGQTCGWIEWGYHKMNMSYLRGRGMTTFTLDYLMWHHFGRNLDNYHPDMVGSYKQYFSRLANPGNLAALIEKVVERTALPVIKTEEEDSNIKCPVLQMVGSGSPFVNDSVDLNAKLDPASSNWMKLNDASGLILEEKPEKVTEATLLFLQGISYYPSFSHYKWVQKHRQDASLSNSPEKTSHKPEEREVSA